MEVDGFIVSIDVVPPIFIGVSEHAPIVLAGRVSSRVDPKNALVAGFPGNRADLSSAVVHALIEPSHRMANDLDAQLNAELHGLLKLERSRYVKQVEIRLRGHIIDNLSYRGT